MESATTPKRRGPHIAVITPCYNAAKYVRDTVASVHNQTRAPLQHILVNDASTDETPHVLEEMASAYPVLQVVHHDENRGVAAARNTGARAVDTMVDYLCFLDADDVLHPHMLETMVQYMERHPDVGVVHCLYELVDDNGGLVEEWHEKKGWLERRAAGWWGTRVVPDEQALTPTASIFGLTGIIPSCSVIRKRAFDATTGFDEDPQFRTDLEDMDLFFRLALATTFHRINRPLVQYRVHADQKTNTAGHGASWLYEKWMQPDYLRRRHGLTRKQLMQARAAMKYVMLNKTLHRAFVDVRGHVKAGELSIAARKFLALAARYVRCFYPGGRGLSVYAPQWELDA